MQSQLKRGFMAHRSALPNSKLTYNTRPKTIERFISGVVRMGPLLNKLFLRMWFSEIVRGKKRKKEGSITSCISEWKTCVRVTIIHLTWKLYRAVWAQNHPGEAFLVIQGALRMIIHPRLRFAWFSCSSNSGGINSFQLYSRDDDGVSEHLVWQRPTHYGHASACSIVWTVQFEYRVHTTACKNSPK